MRILIVEDETDMARLIGKRLEKAGYACDHVVNLADALEALRQFSYQLMLLDRRLPDGDGAEAVPALRKLQPGVRIVMVSALDAPRERVEGLDAGADDYLVKPFDGDELMARVRARLRSPSGTKAPAITAGDLSFDASGRQFCVADMPMNLHKREFTLLESLMRRIDRVVARSVLMEEVYGFDDMVSPGALDTLVSRLRKRLESVDAGVEIHLVRGRGYLLSEIGS
jgi:DNA-binding response OmpR family regulator